MSAYLKSPAAGTAFRDVTYVNGGPSTNNDWGSVLVQIDG